MSEWEGVGGMMRLEGPPALEGIAPDKACVMRAERPATIFACADSEGNRADEEEGMDEDCARTGVAKFAPEESPGGTEPGSGCDDSARRRDRLGGDCSIAADSGRARFRAEEDSAGTARDGGDEGNQRGPVRARLPKDWMSPQAL